MTGTSEGSKKAARTRGKQSLSEAGRKGGQQRSNSNKRQGSSQKQQERNTH